MPYTWITPKTDWALGSEFTYNDYNRIRNNLLYLNDKMNDIAPEKAVILDLGNAKTSYDNNYRASEFEAFEKALLSFTRIGVDLNLGSPAVHVDNGFFIGYADLNRIEKSCLKWYGGGKPVSSCYIDPSSFILGSKNNEKHRKQKAKVVVPSSGSVCTAEWISSDESIVTIEVTSPNIVHNVGSATITANVIQNGSVVATATASVQVEEMIEHTGLHKVGSASPVVYTAWNMVMYVGTTSKPYELIIKPESASSNTYNVVSDREDIATVTKNNDGTYTIKAIKVSEYTEEEGYERATIWFYSNSWNSPLAFIIVKPKP